jgi:hypothetical protein
VSGGGHRLEPHRGGRLRLAYANVLIATDPAACHYEAEAQSLNLFVPGQTVRDFQVAPHTTAAKPHVETFDGAPTLTDYSVTITCVDASGQQTDPIGSVQLSQMW